MYVECSLVLETAKDQGSEENRCDSEDYIGLVSHLSRVFLCTLCVPTLLSSHHHSHHSLLFLSY